MEMRELGDTGLRVSVLGLGTVKLGRDRQVKYPEGFQIPDDRAANELLARARDLGINLLDTAPAYGRSEERLGGLITRRQDWLLISKAGEEFDGKESVYDFSPASVRASLERSLKRLKTDHLDIFLLHSDGRDEEILADAELLAALEDMKRAGLIRAHGISTKTLAGGLKAVEALDVVMVSLNAEDTECRPVVEAAAVAGKGVLIKKALASGHLAQGAEPLSPARALKDIADIRGVGSIIVGTISPDHLAENARLLD